MTRKRIMKMLKTVEDLEKDALALLKRVSKSIQLLSESPLPYRDQEPQLTKIRKAIDKVWNTCQFLDPEKSNSLNLECKNLLNAMNLASESSSELMKIQWAEERQALAVDRTSDRYLSELARMSSHY